MTPQVEPSKVSEGASDQTVHRLLDKIDEICDDARDGGLSCEDVRTLEKAWKAIMTIESVKRL